MKLALVLNFLIPLGIISMLLPSLVALVFGVNDSYRAALTVFLVISFTLLFIWQCLGLLRTGELKTRETGERLWSTGFQILIVLSVLFVIVLGIGVFQQITSLDNARREHNFSFTRSYEFTVDSGQGIIRVSGDLEPGVTRELTELLKKSPSVHTIELDSSGGQIYEGRGLHQLVKRRGLNTLVTKRCLSACTMAFLGGVERRVGNNGKIGFHQYKTHSIQPNINVEKEQSRDEELMLLQGVSKEFVQRVFTASPDDMWVPDNADLYAAGVVNVSLDD